MPSKPAAKEKVVKGDEAEEMVLQYMKAVNRPYASTDVSANLKNQVPKTAAQKILVTLAEKGNLTMKTYGKQTIFVYAQDQLPVLTAKQLSVLGDDLRATQAELDEKRKELRTLQTELSVKEAQPRTKELGKEIERVKAENDVTLQAILPFRGTGGNKAIVPLSAGEIKKIDDDFAKWRKEWMNRKKVYKDALGSLQDAGQVQDVPTLEDEQGISPDDEETKEVEAGEFCRPGVKTMARVKQVQKVIAAERPDSGSMEESGPKKKARKA